MENRCQRCDRVLSDPNAVFGWRCAEILGVSGELSKMGADIFRKFVDGVMKAQRLFGNSNFEFTDEQWKKLYSAFAKMSLWDGVDEKKVKEARKEGYSVVNRIKSKVTDFSDSLADYYENVIQKGLDYKALNSVVDSIWKTGAVVLDKAGYDLSSDLLKLAASGSGNKYVAKEGSYASSLLKNDKGLNDFVKSTIEEYAKKQKSPNPSIPTVSYKIPLGNGDLGAALHKVDIDIDAKRKRDGKWNAKVKVTDKFDFTDFVLPINQGSLKNNLLWAANDFAFWDSKLGMLDLVEVEITYNQKY